MSTHVPDFQSFFRFFGSFCNGQIIATSSIMVKIFIFISVGQGSARKPISLRSLGDPRETALGVARSSHFTSSIINMTQMFRPLRHRRRPPQPATLTHHIPV